MVTTTLAACTGGSSGTPSGPKDPAAQAAGTFLAAWARLDVDAAAAATDDPDVAKTLLGETISTLRVSKAVLTPGASVPLPSPGAASPGSASPAGSPAAAPVGPPPATPVAGSRLVPFHAVLTLDALGDWAYDGRVVAVPKAGGGWTVHVDPATIHPELTAGTRLGRLRDLPDRAPVLDRQGRALMSPRPVVEIGVEPGKATDPKALDAAAALLDVDPAGLRSRMAAARADQLVPVITLRPQAWAPVAAKVRAVPGIIVSDGTRTLAPTPTFARGVLGQVLPATKETLAAAGPYASSVDDIGATGLQASFQQQLAGRPGGAVRLIDRTDQAVVKTLEEFPAKPGAPLRTTLDLDLQADAEAALATGGGPGALVALDARTGAILAAASSPEDGTDKALAGQYPPGSTFKVVTAAELLSRGQSPAATVPCPKSVVIDGKEFHNQGGFELGSVPFRTDFAQSCNTAFVGLAKDLPSDALSTRAADFGFGTTLDLGVPSFDGSAPEADTAVDRAAAGIGQGKVLASPLVMAGVAATVESGAYHQPYLLTDRKPSAAAKPLDPTLDASLKALMSGVVTQGSGRALRGLSGDVGAKTGTAEHGDTSGTPHAWFIAYRGPLAVAVLLESGGSGGADAGPVARAFFDKAGVLG
jgi:cell division protein FtsI/penicillin-binding protein 2